MCVRINGPGDPNLLTLKLVCELYLRWGTFLPNLGTLGLWVLELFAMYATDGQKQCLLPLPYGRVHNKFSCVSYVVLICKYVKIWNS